MAAVTHAPVGAFWWSWRAFCEPTLELKQFTHEDLDTSILDCCHLLPTSPHARNFYAAWVGRVHLVHFVYYSWWDTFDLCSFQFLKLLKFPNILHA